MLRDFELISLDNRYSAKTAQRNADLLVREKVDLAIEFQTDEVIAGIARGRTPLVLVENYVSQPVHAVLADNFTVWENIVLGREPGTPVNLAAGEARRALRDRLTPPKG